MIARSVPCFRLFATSIGPVVNAILSVKKRRASCGSFFVSGVAITFFFHSKSFSHRRLSRRFLDEIVLALTHDHHRTRRMTRHPFRGAADENVRKASASV